MQWTIGDVRVTKVVEHELPIPLNGLLTDVPEGAADRHGWLRPDFLDDAGLARLSIHGLVIDTGERRILVDTCVGNLREGLVFPPAESTLTSSPLIGIVSPGLMILCSWLAIASMYAL